MIVFIPAPVFIDNVEFAMGDITILTPVVNPGPDFRFCKLIKAGTRHW